MATDHTYSEIQDGINDLDTPDTVENNLLYALDQIQSSFGSSSSTTQKVSLIILHSNTFSFFTFSREIRELFPACALPTSQILASASAGNNGR